MTQKDENSKITDKWEVETLLRQNWSNMFIKAFKTYFGDVDLVNLFGKISFNGLS